LSVERDEEVEIVMSAEQSFNCAKYIFRFFSVTFLEALQESVIVWDHKTNATHDKHHPRPPRYLSKQFRENKQKLRAEDLEIFTCARAAFGGKFPSNFFSVFT
jgi:hypothetical protein